MTHFLAVSFSLMADSAGAVSALRDYVAPASRSLAALASVVCVFFVINGGYLYITSSGKPATLEHAKQVVRRALIGLVIVLSATALVGILTNAYGHPARGATSSLPALQAITPAPVSNGLVDILIKAVIGFLDAIIQAVAAPFLTALGFFTSGTPLMASNPSVFNLWVAIVGITDVLFAVVLTLLGMHVMSAASFGFDEIELKHFLPRAGLVFLLVNTSIFAIDGVIALSNALISAIGKVSSNSSVWLTLSTVVKESGGQGLAALLLMLAFLIFSIFLIVYYVLRLVTLFIGAVLSPLVILVWLIPGFRDFSETAIKTYLTTIFTLFVHVVILLLAASFFTGLSATSGNKVPDILMAMVVGLATVMALLKTQSIMMQFSYVSIGSRNARKLGGQFLNGVSYIAGTGRSWTSGATPRSISAVSSSSAQASRSYQGVGSTLVRSMPQGGQSKSVLKVTHVPRSTEIKKSSTRATTASTNNKHGKIA